MVLGVNYRMDKQSQATSLKEANLRAQNLSERLARLESNALNDREVRQIFKEYFEPFTKSIVQMQKDMQSVKIELAKLSTTV